MALLTMNQALLDELAASMLGFLAGDEERFGRFLAVTGLAVGDLRGLAGERHFAESLLDYISADERLLLTFAAETGHDPGSLAAARQALTPPFPEP